MKKCQLYQLSRVISKFSNYQLNQILSFFFKRQGTSSTFQSFKFEGQVIFENSTSIKSWLLKLVSLFYIDIRFPSSINERHFVDTQICTHDLIKEDDQSDHPCTKKKKIIYTSHASICSCIVCINSFIAYHKNDLEILMVATMFPVSKSDHQIERYHMIKFALSTCIVFRQNRPHMINLN